MKCVRLCLLVLLIGCSDSPVENNEQPSETASPQDAQSTQLDEENPSTSPPEIVSLKNEQSIKRYLEAAFGSEFQKSTLGFKLDNDEVEAEIHAFGGDLNSIILQFKPLSEETIEKAVLFTRKLIIAAGENPREVEEKIDKGRAGYAADSDGVELKFSNDTYVRFSIWSAGRQERAGVVIEPN